MRADSARPYVSVDPAVRFGQPHIRGVSVEVVGGMVWAGESVDTVCHEYTLTRGEVLVACWHLGTHGARAWRRRWRDWATSVHGDLAHSRYEVPAPPARQAAR